MQFEYDPERLIEEVKKRPGVWDFDHPDYRTKNLRYSLWSEIVTELVHTGTKMTKSEIRELEIELRKKWKSIRDCFQKYIINPNRSRRPYIYSKQLRFLLKDQELPKRCSKKGGFSSENEEPTTSKAWRPKKKIKLAIKEDKSSDEEQADEDLINFDNTEDSREYSNDETIAPTPNKRSKLVNENDDVEKPDEFAFASVDTPSRIIDNDDPDKMFLISLLPHLKSIPEQFKLNVKMELMQVLRSACYSTSKFQNSL